MKKALKIILWIILAIIVIAALFFGYLTLREYKPADVTPVGVRGDSSGEKVPSGKEIVVLSWNTGYAALGKNSDFVMDGGGNVPPADKEQVNEYMTGIKNTLDSLNADIYMLQEVDEDSDRSFNTDQRDVYTAGQDAIGYNYKCDYVPFPWPPMGKVNSGVFTTTGYSIDSADRYSLPCPFSWPLRIANLKRCLLASYLPIEGSDKQLVIVNFHLEAYDSGEGKIAQTKQLLEFIEGEYAKGNYVIAGGDWNQTFPGSLDVYPNTHEDLWAVGLIDSGSFKDGWTLAYDTSSPTCRLLNQPYNPDDGVNTQYYVIDGFVCSPNVNVISCNTVDEGFENSDHNPVRMIVTLK